jgi:sulfur carrier protein ThiS
LLIARGSQMLPSAPLFPLTSGDQLTLVPMISGG